MNALSTIAAALDPACLARDCGLEPDPWQLKVLRSESPRALLLCSRQTGKSTTTALLALHTILFQPGSLVLLLSPSQRQSGELFRKVMGFYRDLGRPVPAEQATALTLTLTNGSRVVSLPSTEETIRGYSGVNLLIVDEASRVDDALYYSIRPMIAVSHGRLVCLSTPFGRRGFFFDEWQSDGPWERVKVTAEECARISPEFLADERRSLGDRWYRQEYLCAFEEAVGACFLGEDVDAILSTKVPALRFSV